MNYDLFLTKEQSLHLINLGIDYSDCIFAWAKCDNPFICFNNKIFKEKYELIPTYDVSELLRKLPPSINKYNLTIDYISDLPIISYAKFSYKYDKYLCRSINYYDLHPKFKINNGNLLDQLYLIHCWILENEINIYKR